MYHETSEKSCIDFISAGMTIFALSEITRTPSAYAVTLITVSPKDRPAMSLFSLRCCKNGSITSKKREGESGHPSLVPCLSGKLEETAPPARTLAVGALYSAMIMPIRDFPKLNFSSVLRTKAQSTLLKAFSASSVMATVGVLASFAFSITWQKVLVLSLDSLLLRKPTGMGGSV